MYCIVGTCRVDRCPPTSLQRDDNRATPCCLSLTSVHSCSGRVTPMRSGLDALRSEPRYWKSSSPRSRGVQRSAKRSGGPLQMLGLLAPWKSNADDCSSASAIEEVSNAAKSYEKNLAILQSSSNLAEEAGKRASALDVRNFHCQPLIVVQWFCIMPHLAT